MHARCHAILKYAPLAKCQIDARQRLPFISPPPSRFLSETDFFGGARTPSVECKLPLRLNGDSPRNPRMNLCRYCVIKPTRLIPRIRSPIRKIGRYQGNILSGPNAETPRGYPLDIASSILRTRKHRGFIVSFFSPLLLLLL